MVRTPTASAFSLDPNRPLIPCPSFEVDIWSAGCILYILLVGRPPFETATVKKTYKKIKKGEYVIPEDRCGTSVRV